ncbi:MAG: hypothetical protein KJN67_05695 [Pontiella sp.]|nr:hypothetical protein [Pontiella sp.]
MTSTAISATTAEDQSSLISIPAGSAYQFFTSAKLASGEHVRVEQTPDGGSTWIELIDSTWRGLFLHERCTRNAITGPADIRVVKYATEASIAVYYDS